VSLVKREVGHFDLAEDGTIFLDQLVRSSWLPINEAGHRFGPFMITVTTEMTLRLGFSLREQTAFCYDSFLTTHIFQEWGA
jgi:hypothetical protein